MQSGFLSTPKQSHVGSGEELDVQEGQDEWDLQDVEQPDRGYGWVCVACCFVVNGFTWGVVALRSHFTIGDHGDYG